MRIPCANPPSSLFSLPGLSFLGLSRMEWIFLTLPLPLCLHVSFPLSGFWAGLSVCIVIQMTFFIILIFKLNWQKATEEVQYRVQNEDAHCQVHATLSHSHLVIQECLTVQKSTINRDTTPEQDSTLWVKRMTDLNSNKVIVRWVG